MNRAINQPVVQLQTQGQTALEKIEIQLQLFDTEYLNVQRELTQIVNELEELDVENQMCRELLFMREKNLRDRLVAIAQERVSLRNERVAMLNERVALRNERVAMLNERVAMLNIQGSLELIFYLKYFLCILM